MQWMLMPLRRYADFKGRSRRKEFWMFTLGCLIFYLIVCAIFVALAVSSKGDVAGSGVGPAGVVGIVAMVVAVLGLAIPTVAVQVRRFHDQDRSGWMLLLSFIPYVGGLVVLVFMCLSGTAGPNRFGPDPNSEPVEDVFA